MVPQPRDLVRDGRALPVVRRARRRGRAFDHFTYWEKFDYWAVFWGMFIIGGSGLMLWFPTVFAHGAARLGVQHRACSSTARRRCSPSGFIFTVHFFNGHIRPEKFPMDLVIFTGRMPEARARRGAAGELRAPGRPRGGSTAARRAGAVAAAGASLGARRRHDRGRDRARSLVALILYAVCVAGRSTDAWHVGARMRRGDIVAFIELPRLRRTRSRSSASSLTTVSAVLFLLLFFARSVRPAHQPVPRDGRSSWSCPAFFVLGLVLIPLGMRARAAPAGARARAAASATWPRIDLNDPHAAPHRRRSSAR